MPKVSVVIPVYNVEKYLKQCLDSVINQTLKDIEIICVDDGSTDDCPQILDEYMAKDSRIKVIHKANAGYGHTMNIGIDSATGEYIGVVESDDYILPEMYEILYNKAKEFDLDIVKSDFYYWWNLYDYSYKYHQPHLDNLYNKVIEGESLNSTWDFQIFTWTGIYKKEFLTSNNIRHNETAGASYQDAGFRAQVIAQIKRAMWIDKAFYMYRQDNPSSSMKSKEKMMCVYNEYQFVKKILLDKKLINQWKYSNAYRLGGMCATFYRIDDKLKKEYLEILKEDYLTYKNDILYNDVIANWINNYIREINKILENSDKFLNDYLNKKQKILNKLNNNIIIYGTGKISNGVFFRLLNLNLADRILFFAETNPEPNRKLYTFDVKNAEEIIKYKDNAIVIVAVGKTTGAYDEVVANLKRLGISNYSGTEFLWERI